MGKGPNIKWSAGTNRLQRAAQGVADAPCLVCSIFRLLHFLTVYLPVLGFSFQSSLH